MSFIHPASPWISWIIDVIKVGIIVTVVVLFFGDVHDVKKMEVELENKYGHVITFQPATAIFWAFWLINLSLTSFFLLWVPISACWLARSFSAREVPCSFILDCTKIEVEFLQSRVHLVKFRTPGSCFLQVWQHDQRLLVISWFSFTT